MGRPIHVVLEPVDNARLANLCGVLDENLRQIETAYDVTIGRRGERFNVQGGPAQAQLAAQALRDFYSRSATRATAAITPPPMIAMLTSAATQRGIPLRLPVVTLRS
jgi:phosphate starvation-inducible protein PhoH